MSQTSIIPPDLLPTPSQANVLPPELATPSHESVPLLKMITPSQSSLPRTEIHKSQTSIAPPTSSGDDIPVLPSQSQLAIAPQPNLEKTNELKSISSEASVETLSSGYQPSDSSQKGTFFLISRRVTIAYGPYMVLGVLDYRTERFEGLMRALKKMGGEPVLKPSYHYNIVRVWHLEKEIFSCAITDLQFCGDGDMDKLCMRAAKALDRSARKAHSNLKHRYKLRLHLNVSCPCHPDYDENFSGNHHHQLRQSRRDELTDDPKSTQQSKLARVKLGPRPKPQGEKLEGKQFNIDELSQHSESGAGPRGSIPKSQYGGNQPIAV